MKNKSFNPANINLNPGGVIGLVLLVAAVVVVVVLTSSPDKIAGRVGGFSVPALFLGAYAGNYLWDRWFPKGE